MSLLEKLSELGHHDRGLASKTFFASSCLLFLIMSLNLFLILQRVVLTMVHIMLTSPSLFCFHQTENQFFSNLHVTSSLKTCTSSKAKCVISD